MVGANLKYLISSKPISDEELMEAVKKGEKTKSDGKILRLGIRFDSDYTISCPSEDVCIKHRGRRSPREEISLVSVSQIMAIEKR